MVHALIMLLTLWHGELVRHNSKDRDDNWYGWCEFDISKKNLHPNHHLHSQKSMSAYANFNPQGFSAGVDFNSYMQVYIRQHPHTYVIQININSIIYINT